jgi:hypothetical protein
MRTSLSFVIIPSSAFILPIGFHSQVTRGTLTQIALNLAFILPHHTVALLAQVIPKKGAFGDGSSKTLTTGGFDHGNSSAGQGVSKGMNRKKSPELGLEIQ